MPSQCSHQGKVLLGWYGPIRATGVGVSPHMLLEELDPVVVGSAAGGRGLAHFYTEEIMLTCG